MAQSDMVIFNEYFMPAISETLSQMVDAFNQASNGSIVLVNASNTGDFLLNSFYDALHSSQRRVDRYAAIGTVSPTALSQTEHVAVKVAGGFGPISYEPAQMTWLRKPTAEGIEVISRQFAEALLKDQLNTAIKSLVAAIENQGAATTVDVSGSAVASQTTINSSHALFGDMSQNLVATIMTGGQYHKLVAANLANTPTLFTSSTVRVVDILGKPVVITDSPSLVGTVGSPAVATYKILSLASNACVIRDPADPFVNVETSNGGGRIVTTMQADYDFTVDLKGYSWDKTNGGASPTDAELATGSNWDLDVASIKHSAGVLAIGRQA